MISLSFKTFLEGLKFLMNRYLCYTFVTDSLEKRQTDIHTKKKLIPHQPVLHICYVAKQFSNIQFSLYVSGIALSLFLSLTDVVVFSTLQSGRLYKTLLLCRGSVLGLLLFVVYTSTFVSLLKAPGVTYLFMAMIHNPIRITDVEDSKAMMSDIRI